MIKVIFVGDEPSKTNVHDGVAFVGAKCFPRLLKWIKYLNPDYYICFNSSTEEDLTKIKILSNHGFKIVALGNKASDKLTALRTEHFTLPHPSGLNRKVNNQKYIEHELDTCLVWLRDNENRYCGAV